MLLKMRRQFCVNLSKFQLLPICVCLFSVFIQVYCSQFDGKVLVISHDGGADDAMALLYALQYEQYFDGPKVIAVVTCHGNVDEPQAFINTQRILNVANRSDVKIYRGSETSFLREEYADVDYFGRDGLGDTDVASLYEPIEKKKQTAPQILLDLSEDYGENLTIVSLGSLTNIAAALLMDTHFFERIGHLYVGASNINGSVTSKPEFNALVDVEAYHTTMRFASSDKVTVLPLTTVYFENATVDYRRNELGNVPTYTMKVLNAFEEFSLRHAEDEGMWVRLDPALVAVMLEPKLIEDVVECNNSIILHGSNRGINLNDCSGTVNNVKLITKIKEGAYKQRLIDVFGAENVTVYT